MTISNQAGAAFRAALNVALDGKAALAGSASQAFSCSILSASDDIKLSNAFFLKGRNNANTADVPIVKVNASDILEFGAGGYSSLFSGPVAIIGTISSTTTLKSGGYIVSTLPAGTTGERAYVTDATAPTYLGALTGGGAVVCPVFKNASAWVSG